MRLIEDAFPVLVLVSPAAGWTRETLGELNARFVAIWERKKHFALISLASPDGDRGGAASRKLITDWANEANVREMSARWCVGSATIVPNALTRGALTALLWFWTPSSPLEPVATLESAVDYCLRQLQAERVAVGRSRDELLARLQQLLAQEP